MDDLPDRTAQSKSGHKGQPNLKLYAGPAADEPSVQQPAKQSTSTNASAEQLPLSGGNQSIHGYEDEMSYFGPGGPITFNS